jgi:hypothetical protein
MSIFILSRMAGMGMIKQNNARKAEKALKEILNKADSNTNGRVELKDFINILEANGVKVNLAIRLMPMENLTQVYVFRWMKQTLQTSQPYPMQMERLLRKT